VHHIQRTVSRLAGPAPGVTRFAVANSISAAGDALVAVAMAGSLFFSVSPDASRRQVLLYLGITMVPFAAVAPLIGPAIDRFSRGHRWIAAVFFAIRAVAALALAAFLYDLAFYFLALLLVVMSKASGILKQAIVPGLVDDPSQLVAANSRLTAATTIAAGVGAAVGGVLLATTSAATPLVVASVVFVVAAVLMARVPATRRAPLPAIVELEYRELHTPTIVATSNAFAAIRGIVGFFVFGLAFALRRESEPAWVYAAAAVMYGVGGFTGTLWSPFLRRRYTEAQIVSGALVSLGVCVAFAAIGPSRLAAVVVSTVLGLAASVARQSFDALVQRRAPLALRGRAFARYETIFQLAWVAGGAIATAIAVSVQISMLVVIAVIAPALSLYLRAVLDEERFGGTEGPDPLAVARRHVTSAAEWRAFDAPAHAAVELASGIEVLQLSGIEVAAEVADKAVRLRSRALSDLNDPPAREEVEHTIERLEELLGSG
jgi:predicted MFS family arabinose efflux permease